MIDVRCDYDPHALGILPRRKLRELGLLVETPEGLDVVPVAAAEEACRRVWEQLAEDVTRHS